MQNKDFLKEEPFDDWFINARHFHTYQNYNQAIFCYDKILLIAPNHLLALKEKGKVLLDQRKYTEAINCFDQFRASSKQMTSQEQDEEIIVLKKKAEAFRHEEETKNSATLHKEINTTNLPTKKVPSKFFISTEVEAKSPRRRAHSESKKTPIRKESESPREQDRSENKDRKSSSRNAEKVFRKKSERKEQSHIGKFWSLKNSIPSEEKEKITIEPKGTHFL